MTLIGRHVCTQGRRVFTKTKLQIFQVEKKKVEFIEAEHLNSSKCLCFSFESHSKWALFEIFITSIAVCRYSSAAGDAD